MPKVWNVDRCKILGCNTCALACITRANGLITLELADNRYTERPYSQSVKKRGFSSTIRSCADSKSFFVNFKLFPLKTLKTLDFPLPPPLSFALARPAGWVRLPPIAACARLAPRRFVSIFGRTLHRRLRLSPDSLHRL